MKLPKVAVKGPLASLLPKAISTPLSPNNSAHNGWKNNSGGSIEIKKKSLQTSNVSVEMNDKVNHSQDRAFKLQKSSLNLPNIDKTNSPYK